MELATKGGGMNKHVRKGDLEAQGWTDFKLLDEHNWLVCAKATPVSDDEVTTWLDWVAYRIAGYDTSDGHALFERWNEGYDTVVDTPSEATPYAHGSIKWDGCSDWFFDEQDECMLHFCNRKMAAGGLAALANAVYDFGQEFMPQNPEMFE